MNHFPETNDPFWQQRTVTGNSKCSDALETGRKR